REEVAAWLKSEARATLARRQAMMVRARARMARAARGDTSKSAPPLDEPSRSSSPSGAELMWDASTTTTQDSSAAYLALANRASAPSPAVPRAAPPPPRPPPQRPPVGAPIPPARPSSGGPSAPIDPALAQPATNNDEPEATMPLYTPPAAFLEKWKREADGSAPAVPPPTPSSPGMTTSPPPAIPTPGSMPFGSGVPSSSSPHVLSYGVTPPSVGGGAIEYRNPGVPPAMLETMRISEPPEARAEGVQSQVTSVTLTTTDMPPPIPREQVRKLKIVGSISATVATVVTVALLVIATKKPWADKPQAAGASRGLGLIGVQATRAQTAAERAAKEAEAAAASATTATTSASASAAPTTLKSPPPPPPPPKQPQTAWTPPRPPSPLPKKR
ncbi:MAG: hypothetical protein HOV80_24575, partial [Polyangiaceae bacterium]|nr:hypothetical protein [Polyangiaceae bacterium]